MMMVMHIWALEKLVPWSPFPDEAVAFRHRRAAGIVSPPALSFPCLLTYLAGTKLLQQWQQIPWGWAWETATPHSTCIQPESEPSAKSGCNSLRSWCWVGLGEGLQMGWGATVSPVEFPAPSASPVHQLPRAAPDPGSHGAPLHTSSRAPTTLPVLGPSTWGDSSSSSAWVQALWWPGAQSWRVLTGDWCPRLRAMIWVLPALRGAPSWTCWSSCNLSLWSHSLHRHHLDLLARVPWCLGVLQLLALPACGSSVPLLWSFLLVWKGPDFPSW